MSIDRIVFAHAREILDSRGRPTVEAELELSDGTRAAPASRPAPPPAATRRSSSATAIPTRYGGRGVLGAVAAVNGEIAAALARRRRRPRGGRPDASSSSTARRTSRASAPTPSSPSRWPAPRAEAARRRRAALAPPRPATSRVLPLPMVNIISGGLHAGRQLDFQDFLVDAGRRGELSRGAARWSSRSTRRPPTCSRERGLSALKADEGGFGPPLESHAAALELLDTAVERAGLRPGRRRRLRARRRRHALLRPGTRHATRSRRRAARARRSELAAARRRAGRSASDPVGRGRARRGRLGRLDGAHRALGDRLQIVGDDLFTTNLERLERGIERGAANAVLVKMNQIGTHQRDARRGRAGEGRGLSHGHLGAVRRDRGRRARRPRGRHRRRADQGRLGRPVGAPRQVQPAPADRGGARRRMRRTPGARRWRWSSRHEGPRHRHHLARHGDRGRRARRGRRRDRARARPARRTSSSSSCATPTRSSPASRTSRRRVVAAGERLRVIGRYGVGTDNIAVDEATRRGIPVTNVPVYCTDEVAEHVLALLLALARGLVALRPRGARGRLEPRDRAADPPRRRPHARDRRLRRDRPDARAQGARARPARPRPRRRRRPRVRERRAPSPSRCSSSRGAPTSSRCTSRSSRPTRGLVGARVPERDEADARTSSTRRAAPSSTTTRCCGRCRRGGSPARASTSSSPSASRPDHPLLAQRAPDRHAAHRLLLRGVDRRPRAAGGRERRRRARRPRTRIAGQPADPGGATMNATTTGCPVHAGFDPLSEEFLRDPYAVLPGGRRCPGVLRAVARLLRGHALRRHRARVPGSRDVQRGQRAAAAHPAAARGGQDAARRRPQAAAVDGEPRPARARAAAQARRPRLHAAARQRDGAAHPRDRRRAARRRRRRRSRSISSRRSRSRCRCGSCSASWACRSRTGRGSRSGAAAVRAWPGAGRRPRRRCTTRSRWCSTAATCASWSRPRRPTAPTTSPARCWRSTTRTPTRSRTRTSPRSCSRSASPGTRRRTT